MVLFYALVFILILCILHVWFNYNKKARLMLSIPGPKGHFVVSDLMEDMLPPDELFDKVRKDAKKYDGIYRFWSYPYGAANIYNPEDIEIILSNSKYNEKSIVYKIMKPWLGDGLLLSGGTKWQQRRKILTPAFHFNILRHFSEVLEENSKKMAEKLDSGEDGILTLDIVPLLSEFTLNSICETSMGTRLDEEKEDAGRLYKKSIYDVGRIIITRSTRIHLFNDFVYYRTALGRSQKKHMDIVHSFTKNVIKERKKYIKEHGVELAEIINKEDTDDEVYAFTRKNKIAMLDLLISAEKDGLIDDQGIQEEVDTFMFEGHDTTASGLVYFLMLLANHRDIQKKVTAELDSIFGSSDRPASMADLARMRYLDCCLKESLRLYPPVPFISREFQESVVLSNYTIPAGMFVHIHIFDLHRREDLFPDADKFDPDRFLPENSAGRHPYAYIPFSAGPRNCIGQKFAMLELKSAVSKILRKFELHPVTRPEDIVFISDLVLRNTSPVYVTFVKRVK
ncbi:hypothetical protein JYU34_003379 [Plutella xylostella]|uniref:Cytochrome P450 n=1 Tax=Plutella xylostella TaxID=51655 RepID=A0ABQ7QZX2_PLUXY|nr:hypothetical protein JYU34_003379 [Plutella xylostella]